MTDAPPKAKAISVKLETAASCVVDFEGLEGRTFESIRRAIQFLERSRHREASEELLRAAASCALEHKRRHQ
jgi:hypothetical protein